MFRFSAQSVGFLKKNVCLLFTTQQANIVMTHHWIQQAEKYEEKLMTVDALSFVCMIWHTFEGRVIANQYKVLPMSFERCNLFQDNSAHIYRP